ncbi:MAG: 50S ribosomal protein L37e [Candidatus Aenigmatarchaeota archaeon]|nr:MAG: 50S ribosomal protein L37e [Candidatus Aenigmarchaeota archaeon]
MSKGKPSFGKHNKITHIRCRRCGRHSYHIKRGECSACGFGKSSKLKIHKNRNKTIQGKRRK